MKKIYGLLLTSAIMCIAALQSCVRPNMVTETGNCLNKDSTERLQWWRDAKLGVMLHWNHSSLGDIEISWDRYSFGPTKYDSLYLQFRGENFDADKIVSQLKEAGFGYIGMVPKHHDGFCMWDTPDSEYNIMKTPLHRDRKSVV